MPLIHYAVCDFCGNQNEIVSEDDKGFQMGFFTSTLPKALTGIAFPKYMSITVCGKECLLNYLKSNMTEGGRILNSDKDM